jgi:hypothetical protein
MLPDTARVGWKTQDRKGNEMKASGLSGAQLDYWVAKAEGIAGNKDDSTPDSGEPAVYWQGSDGEIAGEKLISANFGSPSTDWAKGGPIIEREQIEVSPLNASTWQAAVRPEYIAAERYNYVSCANGPTPLVAAMRAYVVSKYGEEVPDCSGIS